MDIGNDVCGKSHSVVSQPAVLFCFVLDKGRMSLTFLPFSLSESLLLRQPSKISLVHLVRNKGRWGLVPDDARFQQFGY